MNEIKVEMLLQVLASQRNEALDRLAQVQALNAELAKRVSELESRAKESDSGA